MKILSKTDLLRHNTCETRLSLDKQENPMKDRPLDELMHPELRAHYRSEGGYQVEDIAESMFNGIQKSTLFGIKGLLETQSLVFAKAPAISQASAQSRGEYARADILAKIKTSQTNTSLTEYLRDNFTSMYGSYHALYEIKSSTKIKPQHIIDLAFQTQVFHNAGYKIGATYLVTVNKDYIRKGEDIYPLEFLNVKDVSQEVLEALPTIPEMAINAHTTLSLSQTPLTTIYKQCNYKEPDKVCPHISYCPNWENLDNDKTPIFYLPFLTKKKQDQYAQDNVFYIEDIDPEDEKITKTQAPIVLAHQQNGPIIDKVKIKDFIDQVDTDLPISFLDFETFSKAVPEIGHSPYQLIPILSSTGILYPTNHIIRHDFIETSMPNTSRFFAESLIKNTESTGTVFAWFMSFEKSVISQLIKMNPDLEAELSSISDRMLDLREPFFRGHYVDKAFEGQTKLKKVISVLNQGSLYSDLEIQHGSLVGTKWYEMINSTDQESKEEIMLNLQRYCNMDTTSIIWIYNYLKSLI